MNLYTLIAALSTVVIVAVALISRNKKLSIGVSIAILLGFIIWSYFTGGFESSDFFFVVRYGQGTSYEGDLSYDYHEIEFNLPGDKWMIPHFHEVLLNTLGENKEYLHYGSQWFLLDQLRTAEELSNELNAGYEYGRVNLFHRENHEVFMMRSDGELVTEEDFLGTVSFWGYRLRIPASHDDNEAKKILKGMKELIEETIQEVYDQEYRARYQR